MAGRSLIALSRGSDRWIPNRPRRSGSDGLARYVNGMTSPKEVQSRRAVVSDYRCHRVRQSGGPPSGCGADRFSSTTWTSNHGNVARFVRVRLAYVVLAHVVPEQLARLVRRIYTPEDLFLIHIDAKAKLAPFTAALGATARLPNVQLVDRVKVSWGHFGQLEATLNGVAAALRRNESYDYLVLLTGRDYPIKPLDEIRAHLDAQPGAIFMDHHALPRPDWEEEGGLERLRYPHLRLFTKERRLPPGVRNHFRHGSLRLAVPRSLPADLRPFQGSAFWWLPWDAVEYVQRFVDQHPEVVRFFRRAFIPEESFFQMVLLSSSLADRVVNDYLRYTEWQPEHWPHGTVLVAHDFPKLVGSAALFGSKFDSRRDSKILDLIDSALLGT